jgi:hypothetical protein
LTGPPGPAGPGGFNGMQEFTNPMPGASTQVPFAPYQWTVPAGVTRVMVDMWGGGGGSNLEVIDVFGGGGGGYARAFVNVTPGATYSISVGGGGAFKQDGFESSMQFNGQTLVAATGGGANTNPGNGSAAPGIPVLGRFGQPGTLGAGGAGANAGACLGPDGPQTGRGASGDATSHSFAGYVLITW